MANIYANLTVSGYPVGYINFYLNHLAELGMRYYQHYPAKQKELETNFRGQRIHFAMRILKTHPYAIPDFVIKMKMQKFLRELIEEHLDKIQPTKPVQLELTFT